MIQALSTSTNYMLQRSLQDLHQRTLEWESSIEFWRRELVFFKKLIDQYGTKLHLREQIKEREHFKFLLDYYSGELMDELTRKINEHEIHLKPLISKRNSQDEDEYRSEHRVIEKQVRSIEQEFLSYKGELFSLVEKVMARKNQN
jgi:hypothetical protein